MSSPTKRLTSKAGSRSATSRTTETASSRRARPGGSAGTARRTAEVKTAGGKAESGKQLRGAKGRQAFGKEASRLIDRRIRELAGWQGETLARMRSLILEAVPEMTEEVKWKGTPVWSHHGIVCTGESYQKVIKLTFAKGARLSDPAQLFNSSLEGNIRRAIDIKEGETVDARAFKALVRAAAAENEQAGTKKFSTPARSNKARASNRERVVLLSGGNPQIAKGDGDAPVQSYLAAMPGWKRKLGKRLDTLIVESVPGVRKAVKWNSPFYGVEGKGWFLSFHVFTRYVKVTFFNGRSLRPLPPGGTERSKDARWIDIYEDDELDVGQLKKWLKQAAAIPGWMA